MALTMPNEHISLDSILTSALMGPGIGVLIVFIGVVVITFIPLTLLAWLTSRMERKTVAVDPKLGSPMGPWPEQPAGIGN